MTATSTAASSLPPVRTSCHVPLSLMTSISEETIALWLKLGALEKLEQAVLDGYGDQLCGKTSRIPQVNKFLKQVPLFQNKIREIHQAVSQGRLRDVQHLIDRKKLAFCRDHNGASPLHKAVIFGHQDVIEYLVKRYPGAIHIRDHQGRTALHYAAFLPDRGEIYQYLLANGADERAMDVYGRQPSYYLDGQNESTLRQLRDGTTLNGLRKIKPRYYGQVSAGQPFTNSNRPTVTKSQIRELIADGNLSALEDLVLQGQGDRLLGETSSVPKIQSFLNIVPMYMERIYDVHRAVMRDQLEHIVILLENKKLAMARDQLGATPLHKAVLFGHYKIAHYISHQFPDTLNAIDQEGRTALHYAAALKDNKNMYGILIEAGANKGIYDNKGKTADYYAQYPEHLNLEEVIKRCHKVNANYLANTASRVKGKSPVRQTPPPSNGTLSSPRSEENNGSSKDTSQSNDSGNENELMSLLQKDKLPKRLDMSSANIRRWVNAKDMDKLTKAVMEGYGDKVVRVNTNEEYEDKEQINEKITEMVERINAIHSAVSSEDLTELENQLEERDFALAKDHVGNTPLHKSVLLRKVKVVAYLVEKFPETINAKNKNGLTALHYAAAMSRKDGLQLYKLLLHAGADPKIRDNHGRTPDYYKTHLITLPNKGMMRSRPIGGRHSETLNRYSKQGVLERMTAALNRGDVELLQDLVLEGHGKHLFGKTSWNEDVKTFLKELPSYLNKIQLFHEACRHGDVETVEEMVTNNDKLMRARDESGALPIHIAAASESSDVLQYFVNNYPSSLNAKDCTGKTALHIVSQRGNVALCKMLKQAGADAKILDQKGKTADFYLQNANKDGPRIENDSSKSSMNSSSDSSYSIHNKENSIRKRSRGRIKKQMVAEKLPEDVEVAPMQANLANISDNVENNISKNENDEIVTERKESLHKTDENTDALEANIEEIENDIDKETEGKDEVNETNPEQEVHEPTEEENTNDAVASVTNNEGGNDETSEGKKAEKSEETEEHPEDENAVDDVENNHLEGDDTNNENNSTESKEENLDNEGDDKEDADNKIIEGETEKREDREDDEVENSKADLEETTEEKNDENKDDTEPKEEEKKETETEEKENVELLENSEMDTEEKTDILDDQKEEEIADPYSEKNNEAATSEEINELDEKDANDTEIGEKEEEKNDGENLSADKKIDNKLEGITVAEVGGGKAVSFDEANTHNPEEKENEEGDETAEEKNPDNSEESHKDVENASGEVDQDAKTENDVHDANNEENNEENEGEEKEEDINKNDLTDTENEIKDNEGEVEKKEDDLDEDEDKNDATNDNENGDEQKLLDPKQEAHDDVEKHDLNQEENIPEDGTSHTNDTKINGHEETSHQTKDHLDELIEHWIKEGDLLRLEHVVLAGQGDRLIERTSDDKQVQDFLDLVPIYMAKIRAVHEAVAKGQLREVRSVLTRKRFALSRDHVGASPLHLAVLHGHTDVSTYIISHFPETMDGPDNEGRTPLHYATALRDNGTLYKLLKAAGADENIEDKAGHSPKYYMSYPGELTLETLLEPYSSFE